MTMKRTELEKRKALKLARDLAAENLPDRFGKASSNSLSKDGPKGLMGALLKKRDDAPK